MEIPDEVVAAKEALERTLFASGNVTGIDFGVRDEEQPDPDDLALRIFVRDAGQIPPEVQAAIGFFPWPVVFVQRVFSVSQLPDEQRYRPVVGGASIAAARFFATGTIHAGTLGAVVTDPLDPNVKYGLSNYHVMCVDLQRQIGDLIVQPDPTFLGPLAVDSIGLLSNWHFPETTEEGFLDAAICRLEEAAESVVIDIGHVSGVTEAVIGMQVTKRGRTTGQTFGWISGLHGTYPVPFPHLPPVIDVFGLPTTDRLMRNQLQIHADFPLSLVFGESGDSGSLVVSGDKAVGLYWGSGRYQDGDPLVVGLANKATEIERLLGVNF